MAFGKPKMGGGTEYKKQWKLEEGETVYRIIPPTKSLAAAGEWARYYKTHYGYRVPDSRNPMETRLRPFACVEKSNRDGMIIQECPECKLIKSRKEALAERRKDELKLRIDAGLPEHTAKSEVKALLELADKWLSDHNLEKAWALLAKSPRGEFNVLKLKHSAKKALDVVRKKLVAEDGIDLIDGSTGAWVAFTRTGTGLDTEYSAEVVYEKQSINGQTVRVVKQAPLTDQDEQQVEEGCPDLATIGPRVLSRDQVQMLVECSGAPEEVEAIMALTQSAEKSPVADLQTPRYAQPIAGRLNAPSVIPPAPVSHPVPEPVQVKPIPAPSAPPDQAALIAQLQAQLAALQQPPAVAQAPEPVPTPKPATKPQAMNPQTSNDAFLAMFPPPGAK